MKTEEDKEEGAAEEKLRQLQKMAEKAMVGRSVTGTPASSSPSSPCLKSHWQQIGNLLLYTAAGVRGSEKVRSLVLKCNAGLADQTIISSLLASLKQQLPI